MSSETRQSEHKSRFLFDGDLIAEYNAYECFYLYKVDSGHYRLIRDDSSGVYITWIGQLECLEQDTKDTKMNSQARQSILIQATGDLSESQKEKHTFSGEFEYESGWGYGSWSKDSYDVVAEQLCSESDDGDENTFVHDLYRTPEGNYLYVFWRTNTCEEERFQFEDFERLKAMLNPVTRIKILKSANPNYDIEKELENESNNA